MFKRLFFFGELIYEVLIFGGAYYWNEFCVSKWVGLDDKNSLKHKDNGLKQLKTVNTTHPWAYIEIGGGGGGVSSSPNLVIDAYTERACE